VGSKENVCYGDRKESCTSQRVREDWKTLYQCVVSLEGEGEVESSFNEKNRTIRRKVKDSGTRKYSLQTGLWGVQEGDPEIGIEGRLWVN